MFILDRENYNVDFHEFKKKFEEIKNNWTSQKFSSRLKQILNLFEIIINEEDVQSQLYTVGKIYKKNNGNF